jgi:hypothetical protein
MSEELIHNISNCSFNQLGYLMRVLVSYYIFDYASINSHMWVPTERLMEDEAN